MEYPLRRHWRGSVQLRRGRYQEGRKDRSHPYRAKVSRASAYRRTAAERHHHRHALRHRCPRCHPHLWDYRDRQFRPWRLHGDRCLSRMVSHRRLGDRLSPGGALGGGDHGTYRARRRPDALSLHPQQPDQRAHRLDRAHLGDSEPVAAGVDNDAEEHALRLAGRAQFRLVHRAEDEGPGLSHPPRRNPRHLCGPHPHLGRARSLCLCPGSRGRDPDGRAHPSPSDGCGRLLDRPRRAGRGALCEPLLPQRRRGGDIGGDRQRDGVARRRRRAGGYRGGRLALLPPGLSRRLRARVPRADPAASPIRAIRSRAMKAALLWLPLFFVPLVLHNDVVLTILVFTFILGILAVSFNLIFGYTGQLSLFHAAAFGIGAYATDLSMAHLGVSFWIGLVIAVLVVTALSLIVGTICFRFRLKEFYFAIVTLAFSEMARLIILNWNSFTNGSLGINLTAKPTLWLPGGIVPVESTGMWYYLSLVALIITVLVCTRVVRSWMGRCFAAIRLNDELADTLGINVFRYKLVSFLVGNAGAAVAGAFYAFYLSYIEPNYLAIDQSLAIVAMALLGGRESVTGPIIGALILTALPHLINIGAELRILVYGLILILTILLMPRGILGTLLRRRRVL